MKKTCGLIAAALLFCGFAGQAMALNFAKGDLIRVVYDTAGTTEYATDLGVLTTLEATLNSSPTIPQTVGDTFTTYAGTSFGTLQVAYYVYGTTSYIGSPAGSTAPGTTQTTWGTSVYGNEGRQATQYKQNLISGSTITASLLFSNVGSYVSQMDGGPSGVYRGTYSGFLTSGTGEASLAALGTAGGYVDMNLYAFTSATLGAGTLLTNADGTIFDVRTLGNGTTEIMETAAPVPIPPGMLLLGTGLLGLIGLKEKRVRNSGTKA